MPAPPRFRSGLFKKYDDIPSEGATGKHSKPDPCVAESNTFKDCLRTSGKDSSLCQFLKDKLTECRKALVQPFPLIPLPNPEDDDDDTYIYILTGDPCFAKSQTFEDCIKTSGNDSSQCQFLKDKLTECREAAASTSSFASRSGGMDDDEY